MFCPSESNSLYFFVIDPLTEAMREARFIQMRIVSEPTLLQLWLPKERLVETPKGDLAERGRKFELF